MNKEDIVDFNNQILIDADVILLDEIEYCFFLRCNDAESY